MTQPDRNSIQRPWIEPPGFPSSPRPSPPRLPGPQNPTDRNRVDRPTTPPADPAQTDAYLYLTQILKEWGLEELAPDVLKLIQDGHSQQNIPFLLQDTAAYKRRFSGNEARRKNGLAVLSPQEYLQTERAYRRILESNGLPSGFYDSPSDYADWIGKDVSPTEINQRVSFAVTAANKTDAGTKQAFRDYFGIDGSQLAAFFLDQEKAMPLLERQAKAASIGGAAYNNGIRFSRTEAESLSQSQLVSSQQYDQAVGQVAGMARDAGRLANYFGDSYDATLAASEVFFGSEAAKRKREQLSSRERGNFSGGSGVGKSSLSQGANSY